MSYFYFQFPQPPRGNAVAELGVIRAEILVRVFNLWDITTNSGNFGRTIAGESEKWRIIDFRVNTQEDYPIIPTLFEDFRTGAGMDGLDPSGTFLTAVLSTPSAEERVQSALPLVEEFQLGKCHHNSSVRHLPLSIAVDRAYREIAAYITEHHEELLINLEESLADLTRYVNAVRGNLGQFMDNLSHASTGAEFLSPPSVS